MNREALLLTAIKASIRAGLATLEVYQSDLQVEVKADQSPLTVADTRSHAIIVRHLAGTRIPILSEEGKAIPYAERRSWPRLWIVDPLDGTKEFIKGLGEFTINIALVEGKRPTLAAIFVPVKRTLYFGSTEAGSYRIEDADVIAGLAGGEFEDGTPAECERLKARAAKLPVDTQAHSPFIIVGSRSHATAELHAYVEQKRRELGEVTFISAGSSLKYCLVAEGHADVYPRLGPTMEWDTAAGQVIAEAAGASFTRHDTGGPMLYNREDLLNPWHVVTRKPV